MSSKTGSKGKNIAGFSSVDVDQLNHSVQNVSLNSSQDGGWESFSKKNKNKNVASSNKQWNSQSPKPNNNNTRGQSQTNKTWGPQTVSSYNPIPPLQSGWNWNSRKRDKDPVPVVEEPPVVEEDVSEEEEDLNDSDDDELLSDEYDSDETPKSHEERKKNKWYCDFFEMLDNLTLEKINEPDRQWHCPACKNGPGAIDWYRSLQSLMTHAKTKGSKRVKIHRDFAQILEQELVSRGTSVVAPREAFGQWKGLNQSVKDKEIVWPPMVVIMNTLLDQDEDEKWRGMGNEELLKYFENYEAVRARHAYGPKGHRGMSLLIFESSAVGYTEAERLSQHFEKEGTHRAAWEHRPNLFYPGGKRQLYGYMATKQDLDIFNRHSHGKQKLKFEMVSYHEKVVNQLKQMNEDNQQLNYYKHKVVKEQRHSKAIEESLGLVSQKLRKIVEENRIVRERTQRYREQNKEELDSQENCFKEQLKAIQEARNAKEGNFDKLQQQQFRSVDQSYPATDPQKREEKLVEMKEYEEEREKLIKLHEEKLTEMKSRHRQEEIKLEEGLNAELTQLMEKYTSKP